MPWMYTQTLTGRSTASGIMTSADISFTLSFLSVLNTSTFNILFSSTIATKLLSADRTRWASNGIALVGVESLNVSTQEWGGVVLVVMTTTASILLGGFGVLRVNCEVVKSPEILRACKQEQEEWRV